MSEPLTREQVAEQLHRLYLAKAHDLGWPVRHECDVPYDRLTPDGQALDLMFADWHLTQTDTLRQQLAEAREENVARIHALYVYRTGVEATIAQLRQQLATARREVWLEEAKACEKLYDASSDREAVFCEALLDAARACREQAKKEQP